MSQENVEIVRSVYEAANRGDREHALGFLHPESVIDATRRVINPTTYVGMDGAQRFFTDMVEQPIAGIWNVRDGRVVRVELGYTDRAEALAAVGLSE